MYLCLLLLFLPLCNLFSTLFIDFHRSSLPGVCILLPTVICPHRHQRYLKRDDILRQLQGCDAALQDAVDAFGVSTILLTTLSLHPHWSSASDPPAIYISIRTTSFPHCTHARECAPTGVRVVIGRRRRFRARSQPSTRTTDDASTTCLAARSPTSVRCKMSHMPEPAARASACSRPPRPSPP